MMNEVWQPVTVLAAGAETVIFVLVVIFSLFGFISNLAKKAQEARPPEMGGRRRQAGMRGRRDNQLQQEIDKFLEDVMGVEEAEALEERPQPRRPEPQERPRRRPRPQPQQRPPQQRRPQPRQEPAGGGLAQRGDLREQHLKSAVGDHVDQHLAPQLGHLESQVSQRHLQSQIGGPTAESLEGLPTSRAAQNLFAMLQNPEGMRQAILINEVFSKPKSQRGEYRN